MLQRDVLDTIFENVNKDSIILDAGCGDGSYFRQIKSEVCQSFGLDICVSDTLLKGNEDSNIIKGTISKLPFKEGTFDLIYSLSVIQFIDDDLGALNEIWRVLKPKGKVIITLPTRQSIYWALRELEIKLGVYSSPQFNVSHHHYYRKNDIVEQVKARYRIISIEGYGFNPAPRALILCVNVLKRLMHKRDLLGGKTSISNKLATTREIAKGKKSPLLFRRRLANYSYHYIVVLEKM